MSRKLLLLTSGLGAAFLFAGAASYASEALSPANSCYAVAIDIDETAEEYWMIHCVGECSYPSTTTCKKEAGSDPGYGAYWYCNDCNANGESTCCHIATTTSGQAIGIGLCGPAAHCPSGTTCAVVAAPDDTDGTRKVAECD